MSAQAETVTATAPEVETPKEEGFRVFIGNLSFKTTEEDIRAFAGSAGEILAIVIPRRGKRPTGFAFVNYKTQEAANAAVEKLNDTELDGRKVTIQTGRSREEQAARREEILEKRKANQEAKAAEKKDGAETDGAAKPKKAAAKSSRRRQPGQEDEEGEAATSDSAEADGEKKKTKSRTSRKPKAKAAESARIDGEEGAEEAKEKKPRQKKPRAPTLQLTGEQSADTIFVANLPFDVDDDALAAIFTNLSIKVKSAKIIKGVRRNRSGRTFHASRGFGFVEVEDPSEQKSAVEKVDGSLVSDRKITAKIANEMKPIEVEEAAAATATEAPAASA